MRHIPLLTAVILTGCMDDPTASNPVAADNPPLRQVPTGRPAECPANTTGESGTLPGSGALYLICVPEGFDPATDDLVVYAHGTVPPQAPLALPDDEIAEMPVSEIVTGVLGSAYATTSYQENGLVVVDATRDLQRLVAKFRQLYGPIGGNTYAVGISEGGLIATLATERHPQLFDGTLAACAPIGDFQRQINYFADFRLAFDFYFAGILQSDYGIALGSPIDIPEAIIAAFLSGTLQAIITDAVLQNPQEANALLAAADIPLQLGASDPTAVVSVILRQ